MTRWKTTGVALAACALLLGAKAGVEGKLGTRVGANLSLRPTEAAYHGKSLKRYSLGFDNLIADLIWIELLQKASHEKLEDGRVSWEFAQLDALTTLDPHFARAYSYDAVYLSVFRRDKLGGKILLEKWVRQRPTYWKAHYLLGHHYYLELGDYESAYRHVIKASTLEGAPKWMAALGVRLLSETGAMMSAMQLTAELLSEVTDPETKFRLTKRIRALRYHYQKSTYQSALERFRKREGREPANISELSADTLEGSRELASLGASEQISDEVKDLLLERNRFRYDPKSRAIVGDDPQLEKERTGIYHTAGDES